MNSNFQSRESRGLQAVGDPLDRESEMFSDGSRPPSSLPNSILRSEIAEIATDHVDMSIVQPDEIPRFGTRFPSQMRFSNGSMPRSAFRDLSMDASRDRFRDPLAMSEIPARRNLRGQTMRRADKHLALGLNPQERRDMHDIYEDLKQHKINVPLVPEILATDDIYAAFSLYYEQISHEACHFEHTPVGIAELMQVLGYESHNVLKLAMDKPQQKSCWKVVLYALTWLHNRVRSARAESVLDLDSLDVSSLNFPEFFEYAMFASFNVLQEKGEITPDILNELQCSLTHSVGIERAHVEELEADAKNVEGLLNETRNMAHAHESQKLQISKLSDEIEELHTVNQQVNQSILAKNRAIAAVAGDVDIEQQRLEETKAEVDRQFVHINEKEQGIFTPESLLELASQYKEMTARHSELTDAVNETTVKMSSDFERPTREKLTTVRVAVDEYNSRLSLSSRSAEEEEILKLRLHAEVPRRTDDIWGKSTSEVLNTDQDLYELIRQWSRLTEREQKLRAELEDDLKELEIEIPSLETRMSNSDAQVKRLADELAQLELAKSSANEALVERRLNRESKSRAQELATAKMASLTRQLDILRNLTRKLQDEEAQNIQKMNEKAPVKQKIEEALLDHSTARKTLADKISELHEFSEKMQPTVERVQGLLANLTPESTLPSLRQQSAREHAKQLLRN